MKWSKKSYFMLLGTIIALLIILYIFPWNQKINTTLKGIECRVGDNDYSQDISITIKGDYKHFLFKSDTFHGTISIDKYKITSDDSKVSLVFNKGKSFLIYMNVVDGKAIQNPFGLIYCTPNFKKLSIFIYENSDDNTYTWDTKDGLFISAPSSNRTRSIKIARYLHERDKSSGFK